MSARRRAHHGWNLAASLAILAAGCGGDGSASSSGTPQPATVKGTVHVKGRPPSGARVIFNPSTLKEGMAAKTVDVKADGTYQAEIASGPYSVTVRSPAIDRDPALETNVKTVEVKAGENSVPIEL